MTGARLSPGCAIFSSQRRPDRLWDNIFSTSRSSAWGTVSSFSPRGLIHLPRTPVQLFTVPVKFRTAAHFTTFQTHCHCHCHCHCHFRRTIKCYITYTLKQASFAYSKVSKAVSRSDNGDNDGTAHRRTDGQQKEVWEPNLSRCTTCRAEVRKRTASLGNKIRIWDLQNKKHECQNNSRQSVVK